MALKSGYKGFKKVGSGLSISKDGILKATGGGGGSTVEINPEGAATAGRLNKLKVDDDIVTVSYGNATTEAAGLMSTDDKTKLNGIEAQANKYVLPTASTSELGGVKVDGTTVTIEDGVISATGGGGGTTVTPNPEGSATTDLTKLGVNNTIYGVKDSAAYHTGDSTESTFADSDYVPFYDASASAPKKSTWSNFKAKLKAYFDTIYLAAVAWSDVSSKPFSTVGDGLTVATDALKLQTASTSQLGGVKVDGTTVTIADGVISATGGGGSSDIQKSVLNDGDSEPLGAIKQYVGSTTPFRTRGFFYEKVASAQAIRTPVMTSNSTPAGQVISSAELTSRPAWGAFRQSAFTDNNHVFVSQATTKYLGFNFTDIYPDGIAVDKISITNPPNDFGDSVIFTFDLEGSNDGSTWTKIGSTLNNNHSTGATTVLNITNSTKYKYWRILFKTGAGTMMGVVNLDFYSTIENAWKKINVQ